MIEIKNKKMKSVFGGIGIAMLLCVLMVLMSWSAMVTNSDINSKDSSESTVQENEQGILADEIDQPNIPITKFEPSDLGFNEDLEMLGMRTESSKTFLDDDGSMKVVVANQPLHYTNYRGDFVDIDTSILVAEDGFYVEDIHTPLNFNINAYDGFSMSINDVQLLSGINPEPVLVTEFINSKVQLPGLQNPQASLIIEEVGTDRFEMPSDSVSVGGNEISYPLTRTMDLVYAVSPSKVKQELIIESLSPNLELLLEESITPNGAGVVPMSSYFGLREVVDLPADTQLWMGESQITSESGIVSTTEMLSIVDSSTGLVIAYIESPLAHDGTEVSKATADDVVKPSATYFVEMIEGTNAFEITTAVDTNWLLEDSTNFPVVIDPTIGANTENTATTTGYSVCVIEDTDCHTRTDGKYWHDYGTTSFAPLFDFNFTQTTGLSVGGVTAVLEHHDASNNWGGEDVPIVIMEDCGGTEPLLSSNSQSAFFAYAQPNSACTGNLLQSYTPAGAAPGSFTSYTFTIPNSGSLFRHYLCHANAPAGFSVTSDQTACGSNTLDWVQGTGSDENGGIFSAGDYQYEISDGDGLDGGAHFIFQTRTGSSGTWNTVQTSNSIQGSSYNTVHNDIVRDTGLGSLTVASGDEMRVGYKCPRSFSGSSWSICYAQETSFDIQQFVAPPTLSAIGAGAGGTPPASEPASTTFNLAAGDEAYIEFTTGSAVGDSNETVIYYNLPGDTGWANSWDVCTQTDCVGGDQYFSYDVTQSNPNGIIFQTPGTYEVLLWDTAGDGSGTGSGGSVVITTLGSTTGSATVSPSGARMISLISSNPVATFDFSTGASAASPSTKSVQLCGSVVACNTSEMATFTNVYQNGGYIEFGLGFRTAPNGATPGSRFADGGNTFSNFYLIVDLEDTTPDATPPSIAYDGHYDGVTSYVEGDRSLLLSLLDVGNPIDTTTANGPKLHFTTDGSTYTTVSATTLGSCVARNTTCNFEASTSGVSVGDTVGYYWTYSDAAAIDSTKIPAQSPNPGRFPASGAADLTFTIADKYSAPTGTSMKLTTLFENVNAGYDTRIYSSVGHIDRQTTYYTESGEFHFEFDISNCGSSSTSSGWLEDQCFINLGDWSSIGQEFGHWDVNWEGAASSCYPGATGCTTAATNTLELDDNFGGPLAISSRYGPGNFIMYYDSSSNEWALTGTGQTGISDRINTDMTDVVEESYSASYPTTAPPQPQTILSNTGFSSGTGVYVGQFNVPAGEIARIGYNCVNYCSEGSIRILDFQNGNANYGAGRQSYRYTLPASWWGSTGGCSASSCSFNNLNSGQTGWSDSWTADGIAHGLPNNGILTAGTYNIYQYDLWGDGSDGDSVSVQTIPVSVGFGASAPPVDYTSYTSSTVPHTVESYIIDLGDAATPALASNTGFGDVPFGTSAGEFDLLCFTTAGHIIFMESYATSTGVDECIPNADESSLGGSWQGFAIGATIAGEDYGDDGMLWQIRDVMPEPDNNAPAIEGGVIGDSHALDRTITATISDIQVDDQGLDTSPVPGQGPTAHVTITGDDGVVTYTPMAMTPSGDRNTCSTTACEWSVDISGLTRNDSVTYHITAKDLYPPGANLLNTSSDAVTFEAANPTNTLVIEWHEWQAQSYYSDDRACSMQVIMYDVTNEIEFHYDETCYVWYDVGLKGLREDRTNTLQVENVNTYLAGQNAHSENLRFTDVGDGNYAVETFDLGMTFLPLVSSTQALNVPTTTLSMDDRCDSNADFLNYGAFCAANIDLPDDFSFKFYNQTFDGSDALNRIQVTGSGVLHMINDGTSTAERVEGSGGNCWPSTGAMCDLTTTSTLFPDMMMAPYWSRENNDFCTGPCEGIWYRTLPFDGQGKTVSGDIVDDTTWYLIDSPIKVNPTSADGYLSITADLTIESGVEVIVGEGKGISFDGGLQADGTCAKLTAVGSANDRIAFNADRTTNANALWHGLAFTSDCGGAGADNRHNLVSVDISNTLHSAIQAGSRPADPNGPSCQGSAQQDCDVGQFVMTDMTFTNVDSAFSHGSGQGTVLTLSNFQVTDARSACFNFAENTNATLTGTALSPSTMTRCNTNNLEWGGAVVSEPGSNAGSLTMEFINITDSQVSLIRTDLQMVTLSDINADMTNGVNNYRWNGPTDSAWAFDNTGVSLGLSHGVNSEVVVTNFDAPNYHQGWICAASKIQLNNVNLGTGFANDHEFMIDPYCGAVTSVVGTSGTNSVFTDFTVPDLEMYRTFPGTSDRITVSNDFKVEDFNAAGSPSDAIVLNDASIGGVFTVGSCGGNVEMVTSSIGQLSSFCSVPSASSSVSIVESSVVHTSTDSAIYGEQTTITLVDIELSSTTVSSSGPYIAYAGAGSDVYLVAVNYTDVNTGTTYACADVNGKTADCHTGKDTSVSGSFAPNIYFGGFANGLAFRQAVNATTGAIEQIPQFGVIMTASTLDSSGTEVFSRVLYRALTGNDGRTDRIAVITGDDSSTTPYTTHIIRASGSAGAGQVNPTLADGTQATDVQFINGVLQQPGCLEDSSFGLEVDCLAAGNTWGFEPFTDYTIGSYADVVLVSPPVTLSDAGMDCAWMETDPLFSSKKDATTGNFVFTGATMVLANNMNIDTCTLELVGSQIIVRENASNPPTITIGSSGKLTMKLDSDAGFNAKIYGEGNLPAVDIQLTTGGILNVESGTINNFLLDSSKTGQLVVPTGAEVILAGGAYLTATDISTFGNNDYPFLDVAGGIVTVATSAVLDGSGKLGTGVELTNSGELNGDGLTITDMKTGINSDGGSISLDDYTSTGNLNGIIAKDGPKLPTMYSSAVLQGIAQNYPDVIVSGSDKGQIPGLDNCWDYHTDACWEWYEYTVDLSSWVGEESYLQPSMMLNYGGHWNNYYSWPGSSQAQPYITMDNLVIEVTDTNGNSYLIEDSTDPGYYPYSDNDPAVTGGTHTYLGGLGGAPNYDCNYRGLTYNPWRFGENLYNNFYYYGTVFPSLGHKYGETSFNNDQFSEAFGFTIDQGTVEEPIGVATYPRFIWGYDDPITGRTGIGATNPYSLGSGITNPTTWHQTTIGETRQSTTALVYSNANYEACYADAASYSTDGVNMRLSWPTLDLTDSSIANVELKFDMMHRYFGFNTNYHDNDAPDSIQLMARSGDNPANLGSYSDAVLNKGLILSNSEITGATTGIDILGGTVTSLTNIDIDDPAAFGIKTTGSNSIVMDGLDISDVSNGANTNYGFYTTSTSSGSQSISNSIFTGLGTAVYLTNQVSTTVSDTTIANGNEGIKILNSANHVFDTVTLNNNEVGIITEGSGSITMTDVDVTASNVSDVEIKGASVVSFLDGIVDQSLVVVDSAATGSFSRDRSYIATINADGNPVANANVVLTSIDAASSSAGVTDVTGMTSGLSFAVYDIDSNGPTDFIQYFDTYSLSTVAKISYSYTNTTINDGDFRYLQANGVDAPTLVDLSTSTSNAVNYEIYTLTENIDVRVCGTNANYVMVAACDGTLSSSGSRAYTNGMVEYGDAEGLQDGTSTMDLTGKAIMIDTGLFELRDGVNYILDNAVVFDTAYTTEYGDGFAQWVTDVPYGTTITMNGGEINGLYPETTTGDKVGLIIGGLQGSNEGALNLDIDGVAFNNVAGISTGTGDRSYSWGGSYSTYIPSIVEIENSYIQHYRGYFFAPAVVSDADYCLRLQGMTSATISGNTFADCTVGIAMFESGWHGAGTTTTAHEQIGADDVTINGNTFNGASAYNIRVGVGADADRTMITNNDMTCGTCIHVAYFDDTSVAPTISGNTFNGGTYGVYTANTEYVNIDGNTFNNQEDYGIVAVGGDFSITNNNLTNAGDTAIYADSLEKPSEVVETIIAGVNSPQPDDGTHFLSWTASCGGSQYGSWYGPAGTQCVSGDVTAVLGAGEEMVIRIIAGSFINELLVNYKDPSNTLGSWDPGSTGGSISADSGSPQVVFTAPGTYLFNLEDQYGDGANGGGFEIIKAGAGSWTAQSGPNTNPAYFWDPGVAGIQTVKPSSYGPYNGYPANPGYPTAYSNTMDGVLLTNNGVDPITYEFRGYDQYLDGFGSNCYTNIGGMMGPIGTWANTTTGAPAPNSVNYGGPLGSYAFRIGCTSSAYPSVTFTSGEYSEPIKVELPAGYEMRFRLFCSSYCGEAVLQWQEAMPEDTSWVGPTIADNNITFDSVNPNPNAIGLYLSNCDIQDYTILTESNNIDILSDAVVNDGCAWADKSSVITGFGEAGTVGYDDDNTFNVDLSLDGTQISGFETGLYKTGGGTLEISNSAVITAGANGIGVHTDGIDVSVIDATFDGGADGTGIMIENSNYAWLYPMTVTGMVGLNISDSDLYWDAGQADAETIMVAHTVTGTVQSLVTNSALTTTYIDARSDSRLTAVDWPLDENKMSVDSTSVVDEGNWLNIDADHLGAEPLNQVGVSIMSDEDYAAYTSPVFENSMNIDGDSIDWIDSNELNPSGFAQPGNVGGPMYLTTSNNAVVFGFDSISTATSDVYIYVDSNDMAGSTTGFNGVHTLPYPADYVVVADSTGSSVYYFNDPAWVLDPTANAISAEGTYLEVSVPVDSLGGSTVDTMNIVATVQNVGTDDVSGVSPVQTTVGTGAETLTESYELTLNKLDLTSGTLNNEVLLHRSFEFSNVPTASHTYSVMVKTAAQSVHTCDFDWATETGLVMDSTKSLAFDILRACPVLTSLLDNFTVDEDSGAVSFDLGTYVDDEQDVNADMLWTVTGGTIDAYGGTLSDFPIAGWTGVKGVQSITPLPNQFGTFDITFEVVDSHGQTVTDTFSYTVENINDVPVICDQRVGVDENCDNGELYIYLDSVGSRNNSRDEGFTSYSKPLGKEANKPVTSFIVDMANEQVPNQQAYTWTATSDCDQLSVNVAPDNSNIPNIELIENGNWEQGGLCVITLDLADDGLVNSQAQSRDVVFEIIPINDVPVIAQSGQVDSLDATNSFTGELSGDYRVTLIEDTTDSDTLTFDLSGIKSDIDHLDSDLMWTLDDTNTCTSSNYYTTMFTDAQGQEAANGDYLVFDLIPDATTNAEPWEVDMLNSQGIHQTRTANGYCEMTLTLSDSSAPPVNMPNNGNGQNYTSLSQNSYAQESVSVTLSVKVDNVVENVPDYYLDATDGFDFNTVNNIMPGTWVPVDFTINAGGDEGPYNYDHLLVVSLHADGHTESEIPRLYTPPAFGTTLEIDDWEVYITEQTTEVWVEIDVVTCNPGQVCTPASNSIQTDSPESHNAISGQQVFGKWSEPGRIGEAYNTVTEQIDESNRRPAFEDKNWCNNVMTSNAAGTTVAWSDAAQCGHSDQGYSGSFVEDWQTGDNSLPVVVTTIGALSVASFAPSIIAVALTGMFVSALVFAGRRDDDEEEFMEETIVDDESAVSPVIATILMVAITVVLSGVVYVWAAQLADTDTKGVPVITFSAENIDSGNTDTDHWKITIGQAQTVLATQAVEVTVSYINATGGPESQTINLASTNQVYGFSPINSDSLVTFGDVVTIDGDETISTFSTGDDIYVKTHLSDGTPLVDATIRIVYNPPGDAQGATLKTYSGMSWNQPV